MIKRLKIAAITFVLALFAAFTGCTAENAGGNSESAAEGGSWLPDVGLAEIVSSETVNCFVSQKQYEELRDLYLITVQAEDGSTLRFRTNKDYYEQTELDAEGEILICDIDYPIGGTKTQYYINKQQLENVWVTPAESVEQEVSTDYGIATFLSSEVKQFTITSFRYKRISTGKSHREYYYVFLQSENGTTFCIDSRKAYELWTVGDTFDILVHTVNYPIGGITEKYYYNGGELISVQYNSAYDAL